MSQDEIGADATAESNGVLDDDDLPTVAMGGAALAIVGSFLPWYTLLGQSALGVEGDGIITVIAGIALLALLYFRPWDGRTTIATAVVGAIISLVALYHVTNLSGSGVYLTLLGGIVALVAGVLGYRNR